MKPVATMLAFAAAGLLAAGLAVSADEKKADKKPAEKSKEKPPAALNFKMKDITGKEVDLAGYKGKVVLIVNVASKCGYTPQYAGLQNLHDRYAKEGLVILGFPANEFGKQEPGTNEEIAAFCKENYGVKFPMFAKVVVKGEDKCDLYKFLTSKETNEKFAGEVKWNFEKFLLNRKGEVIGRYLSAVDPESEDLTSAIESALADK